MDVVEQAVEAIRGGQPVLLPTDTVYGLCAGAYSSVPSERLLRLKGRSREQPTALLTSDVDLLLECVPELRGRSATIARALLPGPYTLVLPNPAARFRWVTGSRPHTIGVRVPELPRGAAEVLARVGAVVATSANRPGDPPPARLEDVLGELRAGAAAEVDGGELPGQPSTVLDLTGPEPAVLREGAAPAPEAIRRALDALS